MAVVRYWGLDEDDLRRVFAKWHNGEWTFANGLSSNELRNNVTHVQPIRVLKDDEVAVKRVRGLDTARKARSYARALKAATYECGSDLMGAYADALEAEK